MAHRKSPRRIAKQNRINALRAAPVAKFASLGVPMEALVELEQNTLARVVLPGDADYDASRQESNPAFQSFPQIIVYCVVDPDVAACLAIAIKYGLWPAIRSGGHSTAGYSVNNGIVIDVSLLNHIVIDAKANTVNVGPGVDFDRLNGALDAVGLHVPSGACGNVCVAGFMQGGGFGYTSRNFGMNCDNVIEIVIMLWDGTKIVTNATDCADLFWAVRGGTGGNFGVICNIIYHLRPLPSVWAFAVQWDIGFAAQALHELQANYARSGASQAIGYMMNVGFNDGMPVALLQGMYCGNAMLGKQTIASLLAIPTAQLLVDKSDLYGAMDKYLDDNPYSVPNPPAGSLEDKISGYIGTLLSTSDWQVLLDQFLKSPNQQSAMYTESYGGAINAQPIGKNAFIHRNFDLNLVIDAFWQTPAEQPAVELWLSQCQVIAAPFLSGSIYQNYPRASYTDFKNAYFGDAFHELLKIKQKYDPNNLFNFQQSISVGDHTTKNA